MEEGDRSWEDMEMDCLFIIFSKLGLDDLSTSIPFVCHSWSAAARHPFSWRILNFRSIDFMPWSSFASRFKALFHVSKFSFSGFIKLAIRRSEGFAGELWLPPLASVEDLILASEGCPKLRKLALPGLTLKEETQIPILLSKWKELRLLELESKPSNFSQLVVKISQNCIHFIELKMPNSAINKDDVLAMHKYLPKLRSLDLSRAYLPKKELLLIAEGCRELQRLCVKNCVGFEEDEEVKRKACKIETFECEGSKMIHEGGFGMDECDDLYVDVI
ncbi:F-box/LRR-repeat protein At3g48880-like [Phalaenopsis equestris]|uniref:F-box/LRR-repeat protein At3g48880-like n=1 Tax=Phalaenopsis equestris TaxID=78828 RepID=UPI0009E3C690|nr:F-box/LRR-repeat protein At3g48880-like [Phalaenopsis equestris]